MNQTKNTTEKKNITNQWIFIGMSCYLQEILIRAQTITDFLFFVDLKFSLEFRDPGTRFARQHEPRFGV